ncbi:peptidylprolyl isomerase [Taibaiella chishuiensis]|uniref:Peptidyl-prolyl cis-trans isomerase n=1 Tax=Taibaiella chishuiensis TaxID=1434707 RepID=A0A2P8CYT5_9BACT|nr:peptidylprolyl isomerase [Taibaiella chishuiensis]PSK90145.1 peptidylprolyl isomerase/peptidyl-prolyl cis-trans isomerase B (cyclophilin B) [Taibaiella chishuiensis]
MKKLLSLLFCSSVLLFQSCLKDNSPPLVPDPPVTGQKEKVIEIQTDFGNMYVWLYKETPLHRENFLKLAGQQFYDNTTFHRIIKDFMIQGGDPKSKDDDPNNDGTGGPGYDIPAEFVSSLKNVRGALATARLGDNVNPQKASNGSQFFINLVANTHLDNNYTVFGFVMKGMEAADKIVVQPKNANDRPLTNIKMQVKVLEKTKAEILSEYGYEVK